MHIRVCVYVLMTYYLPSRGSPDAKIAAAVCALVGCASVSEVDELDAKIAGFDIKVSDVTACMLCVRAQYVCMCGCV